MAPVIEKLTDSAIAAGADSFAAAREFFEGVKAAAKANKAGADAVVERLQKVFYKKTQKRGGSKKSTAPTFEEWLIDSGFKVICAESRVADSKFNAFRAEPKVSDSEFSAFSAELKVADSELNAPSTELKALYSEFSDLNYGRIKRSQEKKMPGHSRENDGVMEEWSVGVLE